ncbi:hypothetical protein SCHPADRAFT_895379 [Schizopora paradoxa]|uniref:Uncharacterized protein n=1 Tax=Schizopora paradoxa TaxID=27342 RepID=A0A0H2RAK4_9AGAM|nr:hypothetical protein SCHPADRAFT_895379 [Schizopora paradoxa]
MSSKVSGGRRRPISFISNDGAHPIQQAVSFYLDFVVLKASIALSPPFPRFHFWARTCSIRQRRLAEPTTFSVMRTTRSSAFRRGDDAHLHFCALFTLSAIRDIMNDTPMKTDEHPYSQGKDLRNLFEHVAVTNLPPSKSSSPQPSAIPHQSNGPSTDSPVLSSSPERDAIHSLDAFNS